LHRIVRDAFDQDARALMEAKIKLRTEFQKNKHLENNEEVLEKIKVR
jgi:hypothetical protein